MLFEVFLHHFSIMLKGTKLYSIAKCKCPRCHEGDFFVTQNPYNLKKFDKMYEHCSVCGQTFEMETGFYYGAMYVSYGLSVGVGLAAYLLQYLIWDLGLWSTVALIASLLVVIIPVVYRYSRITWINLFVKYDPQASKTPGSHGKPAISKY